MSLTAVAPALERCPSCGHVLGEAVSGLLRIQHRGRTALVLFTTCPRRGCRGSWTSARYRGVVDHARGLKRVG
jgi:hypothetical protein